MLPRKGMKTLRFILDALVQQPGGIVIVLADKDSIKNSLRFKTLDGGKLSRCFQEFGNNLHREPKAFHSILKAYRTSTYSDKWEKWLLESLVDDLRPPLAK